MEKEGNSLTSGRKIQSGELASKEIEEALSPEDYFDMVKEEVLKKYEKEMFATALNDKNNDYFYYSVLSLASEMQFEERLTNEYDYAPMFDFQRMVEGALSKKPTLRDYGAFKRLVIDRDLDLYEKLYIAPKYEGIISNLTKENHALKAKLQILQQKDRRKDRIRKGIHTDER